MRPHVQNAVEDYIKNIELPHKVRSLISQANYDLQLGPVVDDPQYPGFDTATSTISKALEDANLQSIYYEEWSGFCVNEIPKDGNPEDYYEINTDQIKTLLLGKELSPYIN